MSNLQNSTFVMTIKKKIHEKFEEIQKWFKGGVVFWNIASHRF